ncbi:hypothetical protein [Mangrovimonas sp. DI 80]|uniref:hypothetical protein n=1 Tax=Mangrovimonas sp. DI 80 TaxID=1779330 RepID=UPI000975A596|nr:hypothetical protein [Mangrovimonas sp. DI 80]OMP29699.1 hypothetical protein BKM32_16245 [Mangrovimonas sp. DI 80]
MTKLEKLYNSIQSLKELGVQLPDELIEETNRVEEEIIKNEVIPALSNTIEPVIQQIQRELLLIVEYVPDEPLQVKMTRKRSFKFAEEEYKLEAKKKQFKKEHTYTISPHTKSKKTNLVVSFPDGSTITNRFAYQTLCEVIDKVGAENVTPLGLVVSGVELVSLKEDDFYSQHKVKGGYLVMTQTSTQVKKNLLDEISRRLNLNLTVEISK